MYQSTKKLSAIALSVLLFLTGSPISVMAATTPNINEAILEQKPNLDGSSTDISTSEDELAMEDGREDDTENVIEEDTSEEVADEKSEEELGEDTSEESEEEAETEIPEVEEEPVEDDESTLQIETEVGEENQTEEQDLLPVEDELSLQDIQPKLLSAFDGSSNPTFSGTLESGETHTYKINVPYKAECTLEMEVPTNLVTLLYDKNSRSKITVNGLYPKGSNLLEAGEYEIQVTGNPGNYNIQFTVDTKEDEHGDSIATATQIENGVPCAGEKNYTGDEDYFTFTVPYKSECSLSVDSDVSWYFVIFDEQGTTLGSGTSDIKNWLRNPGVYFVYVGGAKGEYQINFTINTEEDEHSNIRDAATTIMDGVSRDGSIQYAGDEDWFTFTVPYVSECTISIDSDVTRYMFFYDGTGKGLGGSPNETKDWRLNPGIYYVYMAGVKGDYAITFTVNTEEDEHNNVRDTATTLINGISCDGSIQYAGDEDLFTFTVPYVSECTISIDSDVIRSMSFFDGSGKGLGVGSKEIKDWRLSPGVYYVYTAGVKGDYTITFTVNNDEDMHGNSLTTATVIEEGTSILAAINYPGDIDYFKFTVPYIAECKLEIESEGDHNFLLMDETGYSMTFYATGQMVRVLNPGTYYVSVSGNKEKYTIAYTLPAEDEHGNTRDTATLITDGIPCGGRIDYAGDMEYFKFEIPYKSECTVLVEADIPQFLQIFNEAGISMGYNREGKYVNLLEPGTYYAYLNGSKEEYSILYTVDTTEDIHGDTFGTATLVTEENLKATEINYTGDLDYFKLTVEEKGDLIIRTQSAGILSTYTYIIASNGGIQYLTYAQGTKEGTDTEIKLSVSPGIYYIYISGNKGEYSLDVEIEGLPGIYAGIKPPPEVHITKADIDADIAAGLYTQEDYDYLVALSDEDKTYEGFYAVACNVRNRVKSSDFKQDSYKEVAMSGAYRFISAYVGRTDIGDNDNHPVRNAAVAVLRGGYTTIKGYCFFFGRINGHDMWFDKNEVGQNTPIVIGSGPFRNVYGFRLSDLHNMGTGGSSNNIVTLFDNSESKWYDE